MPTSSSYRRACWEPLENLTHDSYLCFFYRRKNMYCCTIRKRRHDKVANKPGSQAWPFLSWT